MSETRDELTPGDVQAYLARLQLPSLPRPTSAALVDLVRAHERSVPFENLLIQLGRPATLQAGVTAARIAGGGGGYCLELNAAFGALLVALGYRVGLHEARCWVGTPDPAQAPVNHLTLTVACDDGTSWWVEVGMSDAICEPVPLTPGRYRHGPFQYGLEALTGPAGEGWRFHHDPLGSFSGMDFYTRPARRAVIQAAHRRLSTDPASPFTRLFSVGRRDLGGADILRGRVLIHWDATGQSHTRYDDADPWFALLGTEFGLPVGNLDRADRTALWNRVCTAHHAWEASQR
jgi:N-hydroxyarylamine O-acetyltransferase